MIDNTHEFQKYKPHKLYSLAYMIQLIGYDFMGPMDSLHRRIDRLNVLISENGLNKDATESERDELDKLLEGDIAKLCIDFGLHVSEAMCCALANRAIEFKLRPHLPNHEIRTELSSLVNSITQEVECTHFVYIPEAKSEFCEQDCLFGEALHKAASSEINAEIKAAGNCIAADLHTAAVFHLMRVAEFGLHKLIEHLRSAGFNLLSAERVEFATWSALIGAIDGELKRLKGTEKSQTREEELQFYSAILSEARAFQYAWRDPVMHARFEEPMEAENVFRHVKRFMQELASRVPLS
jgi:hypothetical protein